MLQRVRLAILASVAVSPLHAVALNHNIPHSFIELHNQYKAAPPITSVMVTSISSTASPVVEPINQGQNATQNHHSGTATITTLEIGQANRVSAIMAGLQLSNPDRTEYYCENGQGGIRICHEGEPSVAALRTWIISNVTNGRFTYQATSTNHPYNTESTNLFIR